MSKSPMTLDLEAIRRRAREHVENGAVTETYAADRETVIKLLNESLATELVCALRYKRHFYTATGIHASAVADEFAEHAREEEEHADRFAARIVELGGAPNFNPEGLASRAHSQYDESRSLLDMVKEDLIAERIAIETYGSIVRYLGEDDPTTRRIFEDVLAKEEEHAEDLVSILTTLDASAPDKDAQPGRGKEQAPKPADAKQAESPKNGGEAQRNGGMGARK